VRKGGNEQDEGSSISNCNAWNAGGGSKKKKEGALENYCERLAARKKTRLVPECKTPRRGLGGTLGRASEDRRGYEGHRTLQKFYKKVNVCKMLEKGTDIAADLGGKTVLSLLGGGSKNSPFWHARRPGGRVGRRKSLKDPNLSIGKEQLEELYLGFWSAADVGQRLRVRRESKNRR